MKVRELILKLNELDHDLPVYAYSFEVDKVSVEEFNDINCVYLDYERGDE